MKLYCFVTAIYHLVRSLFCGNMHLLSVDVSKQIRTELGWDSRTWEVKMYQFYMILLKR